MGDLEPGPVDPAHRLRVSDADRHQVAEILREAAGEGRLDLDELDERLEAAYAAKVYADLVPIVVDLPGHGLAVPQLAAPAQQPRASGSARPPAVTGGPRHETSLAIMGGQDRRGVWEVGATYTALAVMGGVTIDLRQADFASGGVVITATAVMGSVDVVVDPWTRLSVEGIGIMGDFSQSRPKADAELMDDSPLVRLRGVALMGGVNVVRKPMPGTSRKRGLRGRE